MAPHEPQLAESLFRSEHVALPFVLPLPQSVRLESQPHLPALQCKLFGHTRPQPPQLASSVFVDTHEPLHAVSSGPHIDTHLPLEHRYPWSQAAPHAPQFAGSAVRSEHVPPQLVVPDGHTHLPAVHVADCLHWTPHPPQFCVSVRVSTHEPAQNVRSGDEHES